mgnify:CR=1 FL=1|jgi:hypothetical protein
MFKNWSELNLHSLTWLKTCLQTRALVVASEILVKSDSKVERVLGSKRTLA